MSARVKLEDNRKNDESVTMMSMNEASFCICF